MLLATTQKHCNAGFSPLTTGHAWYRKKYAFNGWSAFANNSWELRTSAKFSKRSEEAAIRPWVFQAWFVFGTNGRIRFRELGMT